MDLGLDNILNDVVVVLWSGGLDSTGMIVILLKEYKCKIFPIFVKHEQDNIKSEEKSVDDYAKIFCRDFNDRFREPLKVSTSIPAPEFKQQNFEERHALRNSDLINNAVRYGLEKGVFTILIATLVDDFPDGKLSYLQAKQTEINAGTNKNFNLISPFFDEKFPCISKSSLIKYCKNVSYPLDSTWSCWDSSESPCGECYPCNSRKKAFSAANL